jgi:hypothetical protein
MQLNNKSGVLFVPELLGLILSNLEPKELTRAAILVNKQCTYIFSYVQFDSF